MITQLKRFEIQALLKAGRTQPDAARMAKVSLRTLQRVSIEPGIETVEDNKERARRRIGRPSTAEPFRALTERLLKDEPEILSVEVLRRARLEGYAGGKSALFQLVASLRPHHVRVQMHFEGLPGEFSQHDVGQVKVRYIDGSCRIVHLFASRLKWSRCVEVSLVDNEDTIPESEYMDQVMVVGQDQKFLAALVVANQDAPEKYASHQEIAYLNVVAYRPFQPYITLVCPSTHGEEWERIERSAPEVLYGGPRRRCCPCCGAGPHFGGRSPASPYPSPRARDD